MPAAFRRYEDERRTEVLRLQSAARNSTEWFEEVERYLHLDPVQFNYSLLTRSQRISHENLRQRDKAWLEGAESWFEEQATGAQPNAARPPMFAPFRLREHAIWRTASSSRRWRSTAPSTARRRTGTSCIYAERAKGGAGLVFTEMTCVSPRGAHHAGLHRPVCARARGGLEAHRRFHPRRDGRQDRRCSSAIRAPKGSTQLGWEEMDAPLASGQLADAGAVAGGVVAAQPGAARDDAGRHGRRCATQFVRAAEMAERAGFDMLELHYAHGYLMSAFITPLTNRARRCLRRHRWKTACAFRSRCFAPCARCGRRTSRSRCASPPTTGSAPTASRRRTRSPSRACCKAAGVDIIDVSAGQTSIDARPVYGRMFQTPFSDRIRNEAGIATMAVGNIYEPDHVNSILMAGRADLVLPRAAASGRPLLDAACRCRGWATPARPGPSPIWPAATSCTGWRRAADPGAERV